MQSDGEVRTSVADLVVRLTGTDASQIQPTSRLKDLGIDSLLAVELADELGRRHGLYLSDQAVDSMRTVEDAVRAVVHHDGATAPTWAQTPDAGPVVVTAPTTAGSAETDLTEHDVPLDRTRFTSGAITTALTMTVIGGLVGVALGFGASALLASSGLGDTALPPISASPTTDDEGDTETSATPTPSQTTEPSTTAPEPNLTASSTTVAPGTRFTLTGAIPALGPGAQLQ
ncbi:MAG: hypothetical protein EON52_24435, partial [Actinomycetales bacterium]